MAYSAFISYSHTADSRLAAALQSALHRFAKPWYKLRALHIFRDQTNLAVNPALWSSIREALDQSLFFILFASPEAAASPWVAKEAEYWVGKNGPSHILIVLTGGTLKWDHAAGCFTPEHTNALPENLLRCFPEEPLFLDLRWARDSTARLRMREPRFHEAVLQLASTLHNRPKDELDGADIRIRRETRTLAASALIAILLAALFAWRQTLVSHQKSLQNLAASLAAGSVKVLADNPEQAPVAALLAIESNRLNPSFEANQALRAAVSLLPAEAQSYRPGDANPMERIRDMAFSPDGVILAVARDDGATQLIDVLHHRVIGYFTPDEQPAAKLEFPGVPSASLDSNSAVSVAFNSTGSLLAAGSRDGFVHIWAVPGGRELLRICLNASVSQVAFGPTGNELITASDDGHVHLFDTVRSALIADFKCPDKVVWASFSPGGNLIAALSSDGVISLFDPMQRKLLRTLAGGDAAFNLAFSRDGKRLASANGDFAFVWDVATGRQLLKATHAASSETLTPQQWIVDAALSPDGRFLAYAARGDDSAHVWNVETGRQILQLKHGSAVAGVAFNADGTKLGTGSYDGTARVWELPSGTELERVAHPGGAEAVIFSPDGRRFAAGGVNGSVSISEMRRADRPVSLLLPADVRCVAFSPDGRRLAIGTTSVHSSPLVRIAETGGTTLRDIEFHGAPVIDKLFFLDSNDVVALWSSKLFLIKVDQPSVTPLPDVAGETRIDPAGKLLASQDGNHIQLRSLPDLRPIASLDGHFPPLLRVAAGGRLLAFETTKPPGEFFVDIWSVARKARISRIRLPSELTRIAFNSSGTVAFTAQNENLQAWDIPSGKRRFSLSASGDIDLIVPAPSSASFATITHGYLTVWDGSTGTALAQLPNAGYLRSAAFSPDGRYLLTGSNEGSAAVWLWRSADLRDQACARLTRNLSHEEWSRWLSKQPYRLTCPNLPVATESPV
ncbi:MAG TPA: TIR domain-containing protein [Bryobacteraceae bacterium]|nr:TIR domain-containing protein [Bryobacteraceae bacterium]